MITKATIVAFFSKGKVIFASIAAVITFSITLYNQFKSVPKTEISGFVSADRNSMVPVDAVVKIISPIQSETQTDSKGRFKFKLPNLQSDTFLLIIQNKKTNIETNPTVEKIYMFCSTPTRISIRYMPRWVKVCPPHTPEDHPMFCVSSINFIYLKESRTDNNV